MCAGLGLTLVTAFTLAAGAAPSDAADTGLDDASPGEVVDAWLPPGTIFQCSMSSGAPFGRAAASLTVLANGLHCARERTGGAAFAGTPSCHQVAQQVGCLLIN
ncbi:hypothetical protein WME75_34670 [Sorangium sp. So ce1014]|uniref:hypothetical protein n=1 Tax=Sorangium sp. So ce1014 TaxID=3133326 RepID=UPI003F5F43EC